MKKKYIFWVFIALVVLSVFVIPNTYSKYTNKFSRSIGLNLVFPSYTVEFHSNFGGDETSTQSFKYGTSQTLDPFAFSYPGHTFDHWNTAADDSGESYDDEELVLNLSNADGAIVPLYAQYTVASVAYFMSFDGIDDGLFGFSTSTITHFLRDTTSTLAEVQAKTGVQLIHNTANDGYTSGYDVYGWVENNKFYWWSEASMVYFHPETTKPFSYYTALTNVDLTGTSTALVKSFAHWFDSSRALKRIDGVIDTSGAIEEYNTNFNYASDNSETPTSGVGMSFMFNDCNALEYVDTSNFDTHNITDMKRMFGGCRKLANIDVSSFDTSKVKSFYWMFRNIQTATSVDLSNFDTSNVINYFGMFLNATGIRTITLGPDWDTSAARQMNRVFYGMTNLTTIYAKQDFVIASGVTSSDMFRNDTKLVGEAGTAHEFPYDSTKYNGTYAKIATVSTQGYFTKMHDGPSYTITYNLDGGTATNPGYYWEDSDTFTLNAPTWGGHLFTGWTGSNGSTPELVVTIPQGSTGNLTFTANYILKSYFVRFNANGGSGTMPDQRIDYDTPTNLDANRYTRSGYRFVGWNTNSGRTGNSYWDEEEVTNLIVDGTFDLYAQWAPENQEDPEFPTLFLVNGVCNFNGVDGNITGSTCINTAGGANTSYENVAAYIDTGVQLFSTTNFSKDFEIYFELSNYNANNQESGENQQVVVNSKYENSSSGYPGFVFRRSNTGLEFTNTMNKIKVSENFTASAVQRFKIIRKDGILYYSLNGATPVFFQDISSGNQTFTVPVWFGASMNSSGQPFRQIKCTLSNFYIKLGKYGS